MNIGKMKVLCVDTGLYTYAAQKMGEQCGEVLYYVPGDLPYPRSHIEKIGTGLPEIQRIGQKELWKAIDKVDLIVYFDCFNGGEQEWLRSKGYRVFGSGRAEELEHDKALFLAKLAEVGLPVPKTYRAEGLKDLLSHLEGKTDKWLKCSNRGDFETKLFKNMAQAQPWLNHLCDHIGYAGLEALEVLVQDTVESKCEPGWDGLIVDGKYSKVGMVGYEDKDRSYCYRIVTEVPQIIQDIHNKMGKVWKKYGYRGFFSDEVRITDSGKAYFIDPCCRLGSPPGESTCEAYSNFSEIIYETAEGNLPTMKYTDQYGAQIMLTSDWYGEGDSGKELCVQYSPTLSRYIKLKNHCKVKDAFYVQPNANGVWFGSVAATGKSLKEAQQKCIDVAKEIKADGFEVNNHLFDDVKKSILYGQKWGIKL